MDLTTKSIKLRELFLLWAAGTVFLSILLFGGRLESVLFTFLLAFFWLLCLMVYALPRLGTFSAKGPAGISFDVALERLNAKQAEIVAIEEQIIRTVLAFTELALGTNAFSGRVTSEERLKLQAEWAEIIAKNLLASLNVSDEEKKNVFRIHKSIQEFDSASPEERVKLSNTTTEILKERIEKARRREERSGKGLD